MTIKIAGVEFDSHVYEAEVDVLYLHVGEPASAVDWEDSEEGDGLRYGADGELVGVTILNAKRRLDGDGKIVITMPKKRVEATDLGALLAAV